MNINPLEESSLLHGKIDLDYYMKILKQRLSGNLRSAVVLAATSSPDIPYRWA